jgi:uncharacterized protein YcbK (DUF882 family)
MKQTLEEFIDSLGLRHFKGKEFTPYWSRVRNGVKNSEPPRELWENIIPTLVVLDELRERTGKPISLLSTYRNPNYNRVVGGATQSHHKNFNAIDFTGGLAPSEYARILKGMRNERFVNPLTGKKFTFLGGVGKYPGFTHLDTRGHNADW